MPTLELTPEEWATLTTILADQPWKISNPILYKMAHQARLIALPPTPDSPEEHSFPRPNSGRA